MQDIELIILQHRCRRDYSFKININDLHDFSISVAYEEMQKKAEEEKEKYASFKSWVVKISISSDGCTKKRISR